MNYANIKYNDIADGEGIRTSLFLSLIHILRKQSMLNSMVHRLNRMWIYDTLTEVFNRAGFFKFAPNLIHEAIDRKENLFILFLDLDGLKSVNDRYGHDAVSYTHLGMHIASLFLLKAKISERPGGDACFLLIAQI